MKKSKQLLFFIIPIALIVLNFVLSYLNNKSYTPTFIGQSHYFKLFLKDELFKQAVFNSFIKPILILLPIHIALYLIKTIVLKKAKIKYLNVFFYGAILVSTVFVGLLCSRNYIAPCFDALTRAGTPFPNNLLLIYVLMGILFSLFFWIIDCFLYSQKQR